MDGTLAIVIVALIALVAVATVAYFMSKSRRSSQQECYRALFEDLLGAAAPAAR